jgi:hypothetical protein
MEFGDKVYVIDQMSGKVWEARVASMSEYDKGFVHVGNNEHAPFVNCARCKLGLDVFVDRSEAEAEARRRGSKKPPRGRTSGGPRKED